MFHAVAFPQGFPHSCTVLEPRGATHTHTHTHNPSLPSPPNVIWDIYSDVVLCTVTLRCFLCMVSCIGLNQIPKGWICFSRATEYTHIFRWRRRQIKPSWRSTLLITFYLAWFIWVSATKEGSFLCGIYLMFYSNPCRLWPCNLELETFPTVIN